MLSASCHFMATPGDAGSDLGSVLCNTSPCPVRGEKENQPHFCPGHICSGSLLFVSFRVCF